jgi:glutamine synthetase
VVGRKGDPRGLLLHMLRQLRDAGLQVTAANHEFSPASSRSTSATRRWPRRRPLVPSQVGRAGDRPPAGVARHLHGQAVQRRGRLRLPCPCLAQRRGRRQRLRRPAGGRMGCRRPGRHAIGGVLRHARALSAC